MQLGEKLQVSRQNGGNYGSDLNNIELIGI